MIVTHILEIALLYVFCDMFLNNFREAQNDFPKIIFTYYKSLLLLVFAPSVLKNSDQRHMMKIVAFFN